MALEDARIAYLGLTSRLEVAQGGDRQIEGCRWLPNSDRRGQEALLCSQAGESPFMTPHAGLPPFK